MIKLPESALKPFAMGDCYTAAQLKQAMRDALEEAAQVCDNLTSEWTPEDCAKKIRAIKETIQ
ncbi:hypothetical protein [Acidovorax sp.]|uniref:hypothetical protein n=1 Tax=Acidovorax sp. TaxID=1872122 RepID=UPI00391B6A8B